MPNGEQALEQDQKGEDSTEESGDWQSPEDEDEEESDESDNNETVDSPPRTECRSKQLHDPAGGRGKTVAPSTHAQKHTRTSTPEPMKKVTKQPKVVPSKARKTLPKIKVDVPVASGSVFFLSMFSSTDKYFCSDRMDCKLFQPILSRD